MKNDMDFQDIITFWFETATPKQWFIKDEEFDAQIYDRFSTVYDAASNCELFSWRTEPLGRLAEIIVLDQFPRNMFRDTSAAFASDALALCLAQEAVALGADQQLPAQQRAFLYMPYMHSESPAIHAVATQLFNQPEMELHYEYELKHQAIITRFGRYPHRNEALGRESTAEEIEFLKTPGSGF